MIAVPLYLLVFVLWPHIWSYLAECLQFTRNRCVPHSPLLENVLYMSQFS